MKNKPFYFKFTPPFPYKKNDIIKMDMSTRRYIIINPSCKDNWWRKLTGKPSIENCAKVKRLRPGFLQRLKIKTEILKWRMFELDAERYFYPRTNDKAYLKLGRMARIKIIKLKKQL